MIVAAWGVGWTADRTRFYVSRCIGIGKDSSIEDLRGPSGRRIWFKSKEAAQARANALNGRTSRT